MYASYVSASRGRFLGPGLRLRLRAAVEVKDAGVHGVTGVAGRARYVQPVAPKGLPRGVRS